jgi:hypothetical protein
MRIINWAVILRAEQAAGATFAKFPPKSYSCVIIGQNSIRLPNGRCLRMMRSLSPITGKCFREWPCYSPIPAWYKPIEDVIAKLEKNNSWVFT